MTDIITIARECGADFDDACSDGSRVVVHLLNDQLATFADRIRQGVTEHATPPGWRLVPLEPTPEMLVSILAYTDEEARSLWRAAVLAAPIPPCAAEVQPDAWMRIDEEGACYIDPETYALLSNITRPEFVPLYASPVVPLVCAEWIPVGKRLPTESDGTVAVLTESGDVLTAWATYWHGATTSFANWSFPHKDDEDVAVTHWTPLPPLP